MSTFDKREQGFESKFALDEANLFKATARRNKLLGAWAAEKLGLSGDAATAYAKDVVMADFEEVFKAPFPVPDEETLAGGLSNTIAGRICNHFGFGGGGYTVDGACASSLLSVANACSAPRERGANCAGVWPPTSVSSKPVWTTMR